MENFRRALELEPEEPRAHYNMGVALAASGDMSEALRHLREAVRIQPTYVDAQNNLGVMYYSGEGVPRDTAKAAEWFKKAAAQGNADAQANLDAMK